MRIDRDHLVLAAVALALAVGFVMGLWMPHRNFLATRRERVRVAQEQLAVDLANATTPVPPKTDQSESSMSDAQIAVAIPVGADLGLLLAQLGEDLENASVVDQQLQARAVTEGSDFHRIPLALQFKGTFESVFEFLQRLESRQRIIRIDHISILREGVKSDPSVAVNIQLSTFFRASSGDTL